MSKKKIEKKFFVFFLAVMIIIGSIPILILAQVEERENYTRWNYMLNECVYYYAKGEGRAHCYVKEDFCTKDGKNLYRTIENRDTECYYVPRSEQQTECYKFVEGDKIKLDYKGIDPDKNIGPAGKLIYTFGKPFDESNEWQTKKGDAGKYNIEVSVSDGEYSDKTSLCIEVLPSNHPPVISGVKDITVNEGDEISLDFITCTDEDEDDSVTLKYEGFMKSPKKLTDYNDAGSYNQEVTCTDKFEATDYETFIITVRDKNQGPILSVASTDVTVYEGETVELEVNCRDPEGEEVTITFSGDMTSSTWKTGYDDAGDYDVTITCTDKKGNSATKDVDVKVLDKNRPPQITAVAKKA